MTDNSSIKNTIVPCKYCLSDIPKTAKVCNGCGRDQRWLLNNLANIPLLLSICFLVLSILQFYEARNERINATVARTDADKALQAANDAVHRAEQAEEKVLKTATELRQVMKLVVESSFITAQGGIGLRMGSAPEAKKRLESNLSQLSKFAQPDSKEEERWWAEIHKLFPELHDKK